MLETVAAVFAGGDVLLQAVVPVRVYGNLALFTTGCVLREVLLGTDLLQESFAENSLVLSFKKR